MWNVKQSTILKWSLASIGVIAMALHVGLGRQDPEMIILHHTVTPTVQSAINGLMGRGLSYHYIIDKNGKVFEMVDPHQVAEHALGYNRDTIGISFVGGGKFGPANELQIKASIRLIQELKREFRNLDTITGHKHVARNGKSDPMWICDKPERNDWKCDAKYMDRMAQATGLKFLTRKDIYGRY